MFLAQAYTNTCKIKKNRDGAWRRREDVYLNIAGYFTNISSNSSLSAAVPDVSQSVLTFAYLININCILTEPGSFASPRATRIFIAHENMECVQEQTEQVRIELPIIKIKQGLYSEREFRFSA